MKKFFNILLKIIGVIAVIVLIIIVLTISSNSQNIPDMVVSNSQDEINALLRKL